MIIFNHGYIPPDVYRTTERYVAYVDGFARNGYIVWPDYRGHAFSDGEARGAHGYPDYTIDVLNATAALKNYAAADPNRIGMWGHPWAATSPCVPWSSIPHQGRRDLGGRRRQLSGSAGSRWRRPNNNQPPPSLSTAALAYAVAGAVRHAGGESRFLRRSRRTATWTTSGPIQLHHGTADTSVPYEFSTTLADQLEAAGQPAEVFTYTGDDHNLSQGFSEAMARSVDFFDEHVKGIDWNHPLTNLPNENHGLCGARPFARAPQRASILCACNDERRNGGAFMGVLTNDTQSMERQQVQAKAGARLVGGLRL